MVVEFREDEIDQVVGSLVKGQSLLVLGESGCGKSVMAAEIAARLGSEYRVAVAAYAGSAKQTLIGIADAFGVPTDTGGEKPKPLTADQLRGAIRDEMAGGHRLLIADDAHRWPASLRYWMEELLRGEGLLLLLADRPPARDIFLKLPRIELEPLSPEQIRTLMYAEATARGMGINPSRFAELQQRVGGNPALARRVVHEELLGIGEEMSTDHRQYIDGTPFLIAALSAIGIVRFVGMGLNDKALYIVGGVATLAAISLRTLFYSVNRKSSKLGR